MKGIDIFCASQAATAICLSMEGTSSSSALSSPSSSTLLLGGGGDGGGGRAIDRHNPIIRDSKRYISKSIPPCISSQPPISPKPHKVILHKKAKNAVKVNKVPSELNDDQAKIKIEKPTTASTDKSGDEKNKSSSTTTQTSSAVRRNWSCTKPSEFISPANSTRYLLSSDRVVLNSFSEFEQPALKIFPDEKAKEAVDNIDEHLDQKLDSSSVSPHQVVVLRVSLHCRGCERKMRKHISSMQGVTSFNIDFAAKKVTLTGNITPLEVLSSISKVKNAQLWSPTLQASNFPTVNANFSKNDYNGTVAV